MPEDEPGIIRGLVWAVAIVVGAFLSLYALSLLAQFIVFAILPIAP